MAQITGTNGDDNLVGTSDNDVLVGLEGGDTLDGGDGNDTLYGALGSSGVSFPGDGADVLRGGNGNDVLRGNDGADQLFGDAGDDNLRGDAGNDLIDGGDGYDFASYTNPTPVDAASNIGATIDLSAITSTATAIDVDDGRGGTDSVVNIERFGLGGSAYRDTLIGSQIDDQIGGAAGDDLMRGNAGSDLYVYLVAMNDAGTTITSTDGFDTIDNSDGTGSGIDTLLFGGVPIGHLYTERVGNDLNLTLQATTGWSEPPTAPPVGGVLVKNFFTPDSSAHLDRIEFSDAYITLTFSNGVMNAQVFSSGGTLMENSLLGLGGNDNIVGTAGVDQIEGFEGDDVLAGLAGADTLDGGDGNDTLYGAAGSSGVSLPGDGADVLRGGNGNDLLRGNDGDDQLFGEAGNDNLRGDAGNDLLDGGEGSDVVSFRFDEITGLTAGVTMDASAVPIGSTDAFFFADGLGGTDTLRNVEQVLMTGTAFADTFTGSAGDDQLSGNAGNDVLRGGAGNDGIDGGAGTDVVSYRFDEIAGLTAGVTMDASAVPIGSATDFSFADGLGGIDRLRNVEQIAMTGTAFADKFTGSAGNDTLVGSAGSDTLDGGGGSDLVSYRFDGIAGLTAGVTMDASLVPIGSATDFSFDDGLGGTDTLRNIERIGMTGTAFADTFTGSVGDDQLEGNAGEDVLGGGAGNDTLVGSTGADTLDGGDGNDTLYGAAFGGSGVSLPGDGADVLRGGNGNDLLRGNDGDDQLFGDAGDDNLRADAGSDLMDGGDGVDFVSYRFDEITGLSAGVTMDASAVPIGSAADFLFADGLGGIDTLRSVERIAMTGTAFADTFTGSAGDDQLDGNAGNDVLRGGAGNDLLRGFANDDRLEGDAGNDTLDGGAGADQLYGGEGSDTLVGGSGNDVLDGGAITDRINVTDTNVVNYATSTASVTVRLDLGTAQDGFGGSDTLANINFVFGSPHADTIVGTSGTVFEQFDGGAGDDNLNGGLISDLYNVADANRVSYQTASGSVTVDLDTTLLGGLDGGAAARATGAGGNDTLANFNQIRGSAFGDSLYGSNRTDIPEQFDGQGGIDFIDGRGGLDYVRYDYAPNAVTVDLAAGTGTVSATDHDTFVNIEGVRGSAFDDVLRGGNPLNDALEAFRGQGGNDLIDGGSGFDRVEYYNATTAVTVVLAGANPDGSGWASDGDGGVDTLHNIEGVRGSWYDDSLTGSVAGDEVFEGRDGNDTIDGGGGAGDTAIYAGTRADYAISRIGGATTIVDLRAGSPEGTDTTVGVELFSFSGRVYALTEFNEAPVGTASAVLPAGVEDTDYTINASDLLAGISDPNADALSILNLAADSGTLVADGEGRWTFTPGPNFFGAVRLTYTVADGYGGSVPASQSFTVASVNDAPVAVDDTAQTGRNTAVSINVRANDSDPVENDPLAVASFAQPGFGTVTLDAVTGNLVYTPQGNYTGVDSFSYTVGDGQGGAATATVTVTVTSNIDGTANADTLTGSAAGDVISGFGGNDAIDAKGGDDVVYGGEGDDQILGGAGADALNGDSGADTITGGDLGDTMAGGDGDDTFRVSGNELTGDGIDGGAGTDTLEFTGNVTLGSALGVTLVERLNMNGHTLTIATTAAVDLSPFAVSNVGAIVGDSSANQITATQVADSITGGAGGDTLSGLAGDDTFFVSGADLSGDQILGGGGSDTLVFSGNTVSLSGGFVADSVEALDMGGATLSVATSAAVNLSVFASVANLGQILGDAGANTITGTVGNDTITGGGSADVLAGGDGNDTFNASGTDLSGDTVDGGAGNDTLRLTGAATLNAGVTINEVETLDMNKKSITVATTAEVNLSGLDLVNAGSITGDAQGNWITGTKGADTIAGGAGADRINGGLGSDTLYGNTSNKTDGVGDTFVFNTALGPANIDTIGRFEANALDKIELSSQIFGMLGPTLEASEFRAAAGGNALDGDDYILYDTATGNLFYDPDGSGSQVKVQFAKLTGLSGTLDAADFIVGN